VNLLKPKQRDLIHALYLSDKPLSQAEYAAKLGIAEESVKQNAWRARNSLKKILKKV
jgi:DNA-directed RNA polymerase specialized sigma24 family protein